MTIISTHDIDTLPVEEVEKLEINLMEKLRVIPAIEVLTPKEIEELRYRHGNRKPQ
ncbi:MAG: hypothetical protein JW913_11425 [Chitinispirillaceae bacterium]|nr:hypothetical protein [Chitinispirillaceae bacterium]